MRGRATWLPLCENLPDFTMSISLSIFDSRSEHFSSSEFLSLSRSLYDWQSPSPAIRHSESQQTRGMHAQIETEATYDFVEVALLLDGLGEPARLLLPCARLSLRPLGPRLPVHKLGSLRVHRETF